MPADEDAIINEDASKDDKDVDREGGGRLAWSSEDTRSLMITFGSTLAANIATVLVVGVALVIAHSSRHVATHDLVEWDSPCSGLPFDLYSGAPASARHG